MRNFLENIYGILFNPKNAIENISETQPIWQAFTIITLLSLASAILGHKTGFEETYDYLFFIGNIFALFISSLIIWFTMAGFFEMTAKIFSDEKRFKKILSLMGFSLLPWIFAAPLMLIKVNVPLIITGIILQIAIWIWSISLAFLSVQKVYELSLKKTFLFFVMPIVGAIVIINWISQFIAIFSEIFQF